MNQDSGKDKDGEDESTPWEDAVEHATVKETADTAPDSGEEHSDTQQKKQDDDRGVDYTSLPSRAAAVHEQLRIGGEKELERDAMALLWSALAAGISMSASMMSRGLLHAHLPDNDSGFLIESFGYTVGFIIVILARQQLFTENTVTGVLPFMSHPSLTNFSKLMRLWSVVLVGNIAGAGIAAFTFVHLPMFSVDVHHAFIVLGEEMLAYTPMEMFSRSIIAGWLIATMVWVMPAADQAKPLIILLMTYAVAIGGFPHIIVGSSEILYLVFAGKADWSQFFFHFGLPTLAGNIIGGTFIFALISHAQIRNDMDVQRRGRHGLWRFPRGGDHSGKQ